MKAKNPENIQILKEAVKITKKPQEWIKLNNIKHYSHLLVLEKYGMIGLRNVDEIRLLSPIIKELIDKI